MIQVTDVGGNDKYINSDLIERIETVPDTILVLVNGHNIIVRESAEDIVDKIINFRVKCNIKPEIIEIRENME
jgi:flagellar protein FlbD